MLLEAGERARRPTSQRKSSSKNLYHHPHPNQAPVIAAEKVFGDEKNISLTFLQSQSEKYYHVEHPNKNDSDSIIFYDNRSYSTQRLSDFKRTFKRRISEVEDVSEAHRMFNSSRSYDPYKGRNSQASKSYNRLNNFSETSVELTPMLLRSQQKNNKTLVSKSHQDPLNSHPYTDNVVSDSMDQPTLMELECIAGYDGGLPQYFFLEAYDSRTRKLRLNITSALNDVPLFRIDLTSKLVYKN